MLAHATPRIILAQIQYQKLDYERKGMMPRTKLGEAFKPKDPPIDWLWAMVLERMKVKKVDLKKLADIADCSYAYMRRLINVSPWDWPRVIRERVCEYLGVNIIVTPKGIELEEER